MDSKKQKRILWLLEQPYPSEFEVPLLKRLGFEVYVPKMISGVEIKRDRSITFDFNKNTTIEQSFVDTLNRFNFSTRIWPKSFVRKINKNFGIAFAPTDPDLIEEMINSFNGLLILRVFGLQGEDTYAEQFERNLSMKTFEQLKHANNIWIALTYDILIDNEPHWLRRKCIHLPFGLPKVNNKKNKWNGSNNQVLFICPNTHTNQMNENICVEFKNSFADFPHVIVKDIPQDINSTEPGDYLDLLKTSKILYYPATDTLHLDNYVLDALACGLPIIFRANSLLEYLAKQNLISCCGSFEESREKIAAILKGDQSLYKEVQNDQKNLLKAFDVSYVEECWRTRFVELAEKHFLQHKVEKETSSKPNLSHIGIWMHVHIPGGLTGEGISRLIAMIIRGAQKNDSQRIKIHIASTTWMKEDIVEFLNAEGIDTEEIEFVLVGENPPFIYRLYYWWINRKPKAKKEILFWSNFQRALKELFNDAAGRLLTIRTIPGLIFLILILFLFSPVTITLVGFYLLAMLINKISFWIKHFLNNLSPVKKGQEYIQRIRTRITEIAPVVYQRMLDMEFKQLADKVGMDDRFNAWFFAYPNNKYIDRFTSPCVVAVPDIVYFDFPTLYSRASFKLIENSDNHITQTIRKADTVITFSEYIREKHVIKPGFQAAQNVHVVPHAPIDKCDAITARKDINDFELQFIARQIIKKYINERAVDHKEALSSYLQDIDLGSMDYLFISSQTRPHKNHLNLIKAYQILLREKYISQKLIFTGRFTNEIEAYIKKERLHLDVLSFNMLPTRVHAAFYACSNLTVAPTLFEGGFPFVFSESLSVKTPAILSDIPVVQEVLTAKERKMYCFNPYDIRAMAEKMSWALENHDSLLNMELKTLEKMKIRTWEDVAEDYLRLLLEENYKEQDHAVGDS